MKKLLYLLLATNYLWGADAPAPAATPKDTPAAKESSTPKNATAKVADNKKVKYKKSSTMEFEGRNVDGNVVSPDSADVEGDKNIKFDPMLDGRKDFVREFKRSSGVTR